MVGAAVLVLTQLSVSWALLLLDSSRGVLACRYDKCGPLDVLIGGVFGNENAFGLFLCAGLPFVWLAVRGPNRLLTLAVFAAVVVTGSRTAAIAAVVTVAALFVFRPSLDDQPRRGAVAICFLGSLGIAATFVAPLYPWARSDTLTGRVYIWQVAQRQIEEHALTGHGVSAWRELHDRFGLIPYAATYSTHNQALDVLFIGGGVALILFAALLVALLVPTTQERTILTWTLLMPVAWSGVAERLWSIGRFDWLTYSYITTLLVLSAVGRDGATMADGDVGRVAAHR